MSAATVSISEAALLLFSDTLLARCDVIGEVLAPSSLASEVSSAGASSSYTSHFSVRSLDERRLRSGVSAVCLVNNSVTTSDMRRRVAGAIARRSYSVCSGATVLYTCGVIS